MSFRRPVTHKRSALPLPLKPLRPEVSPEVSQADLPQPDSIAADTLQLVNSADVMERRPYGFSGVHQRQHLYLPGGEVFTQVGSQASAPQAGRNSLIVPNHPFGALRSVGDELDPNEEMDDEEFNETYVFEDTETHAEQ
jgi:hypothetical protein